MQATVDAAWPERLRLTSMVVTGDDLMNVKTRVKAGALAANANQTLVRRDPKK